MGIARATRDRMALVLQIAEKPVAYLLTLLKKKKNLKKISIHYIMTSRQWDINIRDN